MVNTWIENPYWEYFCGEVYLQTEAPVDPSSLTRWTKRIGEVGVETLLMATIEAARRGGVVKALAAQIGRYAHAKQFKRMRRVVRTLPTRGGRMQREVARQLDTLPEPARAKVGDLLARTGRILAQRTKDKNKLYALHAPEAECISKGKARTPYEFGVKVSIATTLKEGLVVGMRSMPGNPYDGHTLAETLEQVKILAERTRPRRSWTRAIGAWRLKACAFCARAKKRGVTRTLKAMIKRRSAIEPAIGQMKMDGRLGRNPLKGLWVMRSTP